MNTYARQNITFTHGEGVWLWDVNGKRYLDALSGIAVNTLGHAHPRFTAALSAQIGKLIHTSNLYQVREQELIADKLCDISGMQEVFMCNSGCEANEAAIKLARLYGNQRGIDTPTIIVMEKAFHGRTLATLSATGNRKVQAGFEPLVKASCAFPTTIWKPSGKSRPTLPTSSPYWSNRSRAKAVSARPTSATCKACVRFATSTNGC
jgi:acetylornithine aminotransferase